MLDFTLIFFLLFACNVLNKISLFISLFFHLYCINTHIVHWVAPLICDWIFLKYISLVILLQLPLFSPLYSSPPCTPLPPAFPQLRSFPWVVHISSLASISPILFWTSPCLFCTYHLCFLIPVPFPPLPPCLLPNDNPPCDLYFCDSVPVLVNSLVFCFLFCFCFCLGSVVDSCEFIVISLFVLLITFFFLGKSL